MTVILDDNMIYSSVRHEYLHIARDCECKLGRNSVPFVHVIGVWRENVCVRACVRACVRCVCVCAYV